MISKDKPAGFSPKFEIVSLLIENNDKILLLHRHPHKSQGDKWGVPAGKVEFNEKLEDAIIREVLEETGLTIIKSDLNYFDKVYVWHPEHSFIYHMYYMSTSSSLNVKISPEEHQAFKWVDPNTALTMNLIDDEDECIRMFYSSQANPQMIK
jgi:8-oxo-dGTP pyrophosphatase MutT (NUDIX family)